ncbi:MAG: hypothetical protein ABJD11_00285 [Gemmatimonadota bacterium]
MTLKSRYRSLRFLAAAAFAAVTMGCQEKLNAPADCPAFCPANTVIFDTILAPLPGSDSSFTGYVLRGQGASLRVSDQLPASEDRAIVRFTSRGDSVLVSDTLRSYVLDSVAFNLTILARDSSVKGLTVFLYRIPIALADSVATFPAVDNLLVPANLIDSAIVSDTLAGGFVRMVLGGADTVRASIPAADSGQLAYAIRIHANAPTGVRFGGAASGSTTGPVFTTFVTANIADTALRHQVFTELAAFNTFVSQSSPVLSPDLLAVGGSPSSRTLLRFAIPAQFKDSAQFLKATLELTPSAPIIGLPSDTAILQARAVLSDFGKKSPTASNQISNFPLIEGSADTVRVEVLNLVKAWQGPNALPSELMISMEPEGSGFTLVQFGSTRSATPAPRLRLTYALSFPFQRP